MPALIYHLKQNEIVRMLTIITAALLPPTLIATFRWMNFSHMPELLTQQGFLLATLLTLAAAAPSRLPLHQTARLAPLDNVEG